MDKCVLKDMDYKQILIVVAYGVPSGKSILKLVQILTNLTVGLHFIERVL